MDSGSKQGFIGIHIADTGDEGLVTEESLYRRRALAQALSQNLRGKVSFQGFRAELTDNGIGIFYQPHCPKLAWVAKVEIDFFIQVEYGTDKPFKFS